MLLSKNSINDENIKIIPGSGVDTKFFKKINFNIIKNNKKIIIMFAGRLLWDKGIQEFIDVSKEITKKYNNIRFVIVGEIDPHNPESIKHKYIDKWKNETFVEFWGYSNNMAKTLAYADIFCFPSYREGFPKVLLEASSMKIPIIAFNVPGCKEIVENNKNGLLVELKNIKKLEKAILSLVNSKTKRRLMGNFGRAMVKSKFSDKIICNLTYNIWTSI